MKATYDAEGGTFTLTGQGWSDTYPIKDLAHWLAFYRRMQERYGHRYRSYDETVIELEALAKRLGSA